MDVDTEGMNQMARFTLTIDCDNDAFSDDPASEIARILRDASRRVDAHSGLCNGDTFHFRDSNGNIVGKAQYDSEG